MLGSDPIFLALHYVFIVFPFAMGEVSANEHADGLVLCLADVSSLTGVSMWAMLWRQNPMSFSSFRFPQKFPRLLFMDGRLT